MGINDVTQQALERAISGAGLRQQAIADNIANANTPGYKRADVDFQSALSSALSSDDPSSALASASFATRRDTASVGRADGNNVDIDQEMSSMSANALQYQTLVSLAHARLQMIQSVLSGAR